MDILVCVRPLPLSHRRVGSVGLTGGCWQRVVPSHSEEKLDLADKAGSAAIPNAAGGVGGHRAAKPHAVIAVTFLTLLIYAKNDSSRHNYPPILPMLA